MKISRQKRAIRFAKVIREGKCCALCGDGNVSPFSKYCFCCEEEVEKQMCF